jgi:hypothetical protein
MEKLIEFLLRNIYIIIIVVGFLLSAIGKIGGRNNRAPRPMPPFGNGDQHPSLPAPVGHQPVNQQPDRQWEWEDRGDEQPPYAASLTSMERPAPRPAYRAATPASTPPSEQLRSYNSASGYDVEHQAVKPAAELSAATLRQAIVWSEVLGPPRAKRSWRNK